MEPWSQFDFPRMTSVLKKTTGSYYGSSHVTPLDREVQISVADDLSGSVIGLMPTQEFLDRYVPTSREPLTDVDPNFFDEIPTSGLETDRYPHFVRIMKESGLFPGLDFVDTHSAKDKYSKCKLGPDIAVYTSGETRTGPLSWEGILSFVEWKVNVGTDGYRSTGREDELLEATSISAHEFRGQMYSYAGQVMQSQHRLSIVSLSFHEDIARVYRFDPSCIVVSEPIFYRTDPTPILEIFWRLSAMSSAQRGYDPTVTPASSEERKIFRSRIDDYLKRVEKDNLRKHPDVERLNNNIVKVQVNNEIDGTIHSYLACKPLPTREYVCTGFSPCGQMSQGFIATPLTSTVAKSREGLRSKATHTTIRSTAPEGVLFWLKDSWRPSFAESETSVIANLKAKGVPNLPDIRHGGDVLFETATQETLNDTLRFDPSTEPWRWKTNIIHHMVHCRIVSRLLIPLDEVKDARELLSVGRDVLLTIATAFHEGGIYHRDISRKSVMMTERQDGSGRLQGVLCDWNYTKGVGVETTQYKLRPASWQFVSIRMLDNPTKTHDIVDDFEALFWLILYMALHHFVHTGHLSSKVFDEYHIVPHARLGQLITGGHSKKFWLSTPRIAFTCKALNNFLRNCRKFHLGYHRKLDDVDENDEKKQEFEDYHNGIQDDVYDLLHYFDDILEGPEADWNDCKAINTGSKRMTATQEQRGMKRLIEQVIATKLSPDGDTKSDDKTQLERGAEREGGGKKRVHESQDGSHAGRPRKKVVVFAKDGVKMGVEKTDTIPKQPRRGRAGSVSDRVLRARPRGRK